MMFRSAAQPPGGDGQDLRQAPLQDVGLPDWSDLLVAVKDRLRQIGTREPPAADPRAGVLACAAALERLHTTLPHELDRRRQSRGRHPERPTAGSAVFCLDLDGCRPVNEVHGRPTADALLRIVGARLALRVRAGDIVERLDGEEFCVLLAGAPDRGHLERLAGRLLDAVAAPVRIGQLDLCMRPSIGVAVSPADGIAAGELLARAAAAMRRARRADTGRAFFHDERRVP
jgi:diguanylate cyclase (GGDEF)-like protein